MAPQRLSRLVHGCVAVVVAHSESSLSVVPVGPPSSLSFEECNICDQGLDVLFVVFNDGGLFEMVSEGFVSLSLRDFCSYAMSAQKGPFQVGLNYTIVRGTVLPHS